MRRRPTPELRGGCSEFARLPSHAMATGKHGSGGRGDAAGATLSPLRRRWRDCAATGRARGRHPSRGPSCDRSRVPSGPREGARAHTTNRSLRSTWRTPRGPQSVPRIARLQTPNLRTLHAVWKVTKIARCDRSLGSDGTSKVSRPRPVCKQGCEGRATNSRIGRAARDAERLREPLDNAAAFARDPRRARGMSRLPHAREPPIPAPSGGPGCGQAKHAGAERQAREPALHSAGRRLAETAVDDGAVALDRRALEVRHQSA